VWLAKALTETLTPASLADLNQKKLDRDIIGWGK
jgi:hypothetical protein